MKRKTKKIIIYSVVGLLFLGGGTISFFIYAIHNFNPFQNMEHTELISTLKYKNKYLGLYQQYMWDGGIWSVIEFNAEPPKKLNALNAEIETNGKVIYTANEHHPKPIEPPLSIQLSATGEALFCEKIKCITIKSSSPKKRAGLGKKRRATY